MFATNKSNLGKASYKLTYDSNQKTLHSIILLYQTEFLYFCRPFQKLDPKLFFYLFL